MILKMTSCENSTLSYGNISTYDCETPKDFYDALNSIYHFDHDPCPLYGKDNPNIPDGLTSEWGLCNYVNPPFNEINKWLNKGLEEYKKGKTCVFFITARTNTKYWHEFVWKRAQVIMFLEGRMAFGNKYKGELPIPLAIVVYTHDEISDGFKNETVCIKGEKKDYRFYKINNVTYQFQLILVLVHVRYPPCKQISTFG